MTKYQKQYQRAKRYYERFKRINDGVVPDCKTCQDTYNMEDDVRSFFVHCYHVRDWIKNDDDAPDCMKKRVRSFINRNKYMRICADLCNGVKHRERNRKPLSSSQPRISDPDVILWVSDQESHPYKKAVSFKIRLGDETYDAFEVATQAMKSWKMFIRENGGDC